MAEPWVEGKTFSECLDRTVERYGDRDALVCPQLSIRWSYTEFKRRVDEFAKALIDVMDRRQPPNDPLGKHVGIWSTNLPEWVLAQFAVAKIGRVLVNINPSYRIHELTFALRDSDVALLLLTDRFKSSDYFSMISEIWPGLASEAGYGCPDPLPNLRRVVSLKDCDGGLRGINRLPSFLSRAYGLSPCALEWYASKVKPSDPVNIQYTSGTTGVPKGAVLTHRNLLYNAYHVGERMHITEQDRVCVPVPFYHCFGCVMGTLMSVLRGAAIVLPAEVFDPLATLRAIEEERCTAVYGVPTMFIAMLNQPDFGDFDLSSLRTGIMAGTPCPIDVMRKVVNKMGARDITIAYGMTECSPVITQTEVSDDLEKRVTTVGRPLPGVDVKIVDTDDGRTLPDGERGELCARGHGVMAGYHNATEATEGIIDGDGWLHTGDLAVRTDDGFYRITGRSKEMIIRGGENLYPREIEEFLHTHPKIEDIQVVGVPDEKYGEEVSAWVVLCDGESMTEDDVREFCRGRIAHQKVPRYVCFVDEYPTTVTGKVQKYRLREMAVERFGLHEADKIETA